MTVFSKGNATCISNAIAAFEAAGKELALDPRACVQLVQIIGRRWSYAAGEKVTDPTGTPPLRLVVNAQWGLMIYCAEFINLPTLELLKTFKKHFPDVCHEKKMRSWRIFKPNLVPACWLRPKKRPCASAGTKC